MKRFINIYTATLLFCLYLFGTLYFDLSIKNFVDFFGEKFFEVDIKNIAIANVGLFASITGFFIAAAPFLVSIIVAKQYLIDAVQNNLDEITKALKVLVLIGILSIATLFSNPVDYSLSLKFISINVFLFLYIVFFYYIYEIIKIIGVFVADLKKLNNGNENCCDETKKLLNKLIDEVKKLKGNG